MCFYVRKIKVINKCLYNYRIREGSTTTTLLTVKKLFDILFIANTLADFFINHNGFNKCCIYRSITHHYQYVFNNINSIKGISKDQIKDYCKWDLYKKVSKTKLRHRINYLINKLF